MGSANPHHYVNSTSDTDDHQNPNGCSSSSAMETDSIVPPFAIDGAEEDLILSKSEYLTREEVIKRRCRRLKLDIQVYEDYYWALMEDYRVKHREYWWNYGKSPFKEEDEVEKRERDQNGNFVEGTDEINGPSDGKLGLGLGLGLETDGKSRRCAYNGCKSKAMVFTSYCHPHILCDPMQQLYKACSYITKSKSDGPVQCGKPILKATVPSLCTLHFGKAQTHVTRALRKAGLNPPSTSKLAPKIHLIVAESVKQINAKRREKTNAGNVVAKEENTNLGSDVVEEENTG